MLWLDILAAIILIISFFGGIKEGAVRNFFSLVVLVIAIPIAGRYYYLIASIISFLQESNWENFIGFFITLAIVSVILRFIFFLPGRLIQKIWKRGLLFRLLGGALGILNASIGMVVFVLAVEAYPVIEWLERIITSSGVLMWLVELLSFVQVLLPEMFRGTAVAVAAGLVM